MPSVTLEELKSQGFGLVVSMSGSDISTNLFNLKTKRRTEEDLQSALQRRLVARVVIQPTRLSKHLNPFPNNDKNKTWEVVHSRGKNGYGPIIYELAMSVLARGTPNPRHEISHALAPGVATKHWLFCDRHTLSDAAHKLWTKFLLRAHGLWGPRGTGWKDNVRATPLRVPFMRSPRPNRYLVCGHSSLEPRGRSDHMGTYRGFPHSSRHVAELGDLAGECWEHTSPVIFSRWSKDPTCHLFRVTGGGHRYRRLEDNLCRWVSEVEGTRRDRAIYKYVQRLYFD